MKSRNSLEIHGQIMDHLGYAIASTKYKLDDHEKSCFDEYEYSKFGVSAITFILCGVWY